MLSYAFQEIRKNNYENINSEKFEHIHDLFAEILIRGISNQLKRGIHKEYINKHKSLYISPIIKACSKASLFSKLTPSFSFSFKYAMQLWFISGALSNILFRFPVFPGVGFPYELHLYPFFCLFLKTSKGKFREAQE